MNAFTVDVEEWFHICGVGGPLSQANWTALPSRVVPTTRRVLDLLGGAGIRATFFVVGWIAERHPDLVREIVAAGHEVGSHSHLHRKVFELTPPEFMRRPRGEPGRSCRGRRPASDGLPRPGVVDRRSRVVGPGCPASARVRHRRESGAGPPRRPSRLPAGAAPARDVTRSDCRDSAVRRRSLRAGHADRLGVGASHELGAARPPGDRTGESRRPAGRLDRASVGDRS